MIFFYKTDEGFLSNRVEADQTPENPTPGKGVWIPLIHATVPVYNPDTQTVGYAYTITATEVQEIITVRALTAKELAVRTKQTARAQAKAEAKTDTFVQTFIAMTPAEVAAYVDSNVTTLSEAKALMKKLALMLLFVAKENFED